MRKHTNSVGECQAIAEAFIEGLRFIAEIKKEITEGESAVTSKIEQIKFFGGSMENPCIVLKTTLVNFRWLNWAMEKGEEAALRGDKLTVRAIFETALVQIREINRDAEDLLNLTWKNSLFLINLHWMLAHKARPSIKNLALQNTAQPILLHAEASQAAQHRQTDDGGGDDPDPDGKTPSRKRLEQRITILNCLLHGNALTQPEALRLGVWRLAARCCELRNAGWLVQKRRIHGNFTEYRIDPSNPRTDDDRQQFLFPLEARL